MDEIDVALDLLYALLVEGDFLPVVEKNVVRIEFNAMIEDANYRKSIYYDMDHARGFLDKEYRNLAYVLQDLFNWSSTFSGDRFWRNIRDRLVSIEQIG